MPRAGAEESGGLRQDQCRGVNFFGSDQPGLHPLCHRNNTLRNRSDHFHLFRNFGPDPKFGHLVEKHIHFIFDKILQLNAPLHHGVCTNHKTNITTEFLIPEYPIVDGLITILRQKYFRHFSESDGVPKGRIISRAENFYGFGTSIFRIPITPTLWENSKNLAEKIPCPPSRTVSELESQKKPKNRLCSRFSEVPPIVTSESVMNPKFSYFSRNIQFRRTLLLLYTTPIRPREST